MAGLKRVPESPAGRIGRGHCHHYLVLQSKRLSPGAPPDGGG